jgi:hypothetical protein
MAIETKTVADLTLERIRRLELKFEQLLERYSNQEAKMDAMLLFLKGMHADINGLMGIASNHEKRFDRVDSRLERIENRLDIHGLPD